MRVEILGENISIQASLSIHPKGEERFLLKRSFQREMIMMRASPVIQAPKLEVLQREAFPITSYFQFPGYQANRTYGVRICYPRQLRFCQSEFVPQSISLEENEEAKVVLTPNSKKLGPEEFGAMAPVSEIGSDGQPYSLVPYLLGLGLDMDHIKSITCEQPDFADYSLEGKVLPVVEFLLVLGVDQTDIDTILSRRPELRTISLTEKLIPTMIYLESLGVDKKKWAKVIYRSPGLLTYSRQKLKTTVEFFYELGLTVGRVGKILTRYPRILDLSLEESLRPKAEYLSSLGVDVAVLVYRAPQVLSLSMQRKWKPATEFFLEKGYTLEEVGKMFSRNGNLFTYSLLENIIPKWEFFLTMDYPMSELVKFPQYFCYSLEERIKPRYALVKESGVKFSLSRLLIVAEPEFDEVLKSKVKKKLDGTKKKK